MTQAECEKWERYAQDSAQRDFEREIYSRCDTEDAEREAKERTAQPAATGEESGK